MRYLKLNPTTKNTNYLTTHDEMKKSVVAEKILCHLNIDVGRKANMIVQCSIFM